MARPWTASGSLPLTVSSRMLVDVRTSLDTLKPDVFSAESMRSSARSRINSLRATVANVELISTPRVSASIAFTPSAEFKVRARMTNVAFDS